jgi:hypothetical protein
MTQDTINGWQPIETAPRDGTPFLVGSFARFNPDTDQLEWRDVNGRWWPEVSEPRHWHPTPSPHRGNAQ